MSIFDDLTEKVTNTAKKAARMSGEFVEITRIALNISIEEDKINKIFNEIGKNVYQCYLKNEEIMENVKVECEKVKVCEENIKDMKEKILDLKGLKGCNNCSAEIDTEFSFCSKCGEKQEEPKDEEFTKKVLIDRICSNCSLINGSDATFCSKCGTKLEE